MENVKGLLSATHGTTKMFDMILEDLSAPRRGGPRYRIVPFLGSGDRHSGDPRDYVVKAERFGIPQARHRVILCGIREDVARDPPPIGRAPPPSVISVLAGMPPIRGRLSKEPDSKTAWLSALAEARATVGGHDGPMKSEILDVMDSALSRATSIDHEGSRFQRWSEDHKEKDSGIPSELRDWLTDPAMQGVSSHDSRSHMRKDLHRYFYAASHALAIGISPKLRDFPPAMLPEHANAARRDADAPFQDRFRVQLGDRPSTTIVSHISKDGHYYIHPDPAQCRSLSVREAARLQTFPDNYHFEGNRTEQFVQVGNAVPPFLAAQIAVATYPLAVG
jgi:DNA (cytosine-5)-methyltransferase 1